MVASYTLSIAEVVDSVLMYQFDIPVLILLDDIGWRRDKHRCYKQQDAPYNEGEDELALMAREEEKGESYDAVELDIHSADYAERCEPVFLLFHTIEGEQEHSSDAHIELLHEECRKQFVGTEPIDEHLLTTSQCTFAYCPKAEQGQSHTPGKEPQPMRHNSKGCYDE